LSFDFLSFFFFGLLLKPIFEESGGEIHEERRRVAFRKIALPLSTTRHVPRGPPGPSHRLLFFLPVVLLQCFIGEMCGCVDFFRFFFSVLACELRAAFF